MYPDPDHRVTAEGAVTVYQPTPLPPTVAPVPMVAVRSGTVPTVASIVLPDGRVVTGYSLSPMQPDPVTDGKPPVSRAAVNVALGGVGFLAMCGGLLLLMSFIAALAALIQQLIILAAVISGGFIAVQVFRGNDHGAKGGNTFHIRKAVFKRNHFNG
ncbi:hypothetical protein ACIRJO_42110 [Streptomyces sp. NPDC102394]|uniref:hypothetical protein n=1 Tax=Streptomyces sp. NPDC102394 TaxID=3366167 RepID=UPI0038103C62